MPRPQVFAALLQQVDPPIDITDRNQGMGMHHVVKNGLFSEFGFKNLTNALEGQEIPYSVVDGRLRMKTNLT